MTPAQITIHASIRAIHRMAAISDRKIAESVDFLVEGLREGRNLAFLGLGKSGHICRKLAATASSLGIPAQFLHATEVLHGDAGQIGPRSLVVAISHSGSTVEVLEAVKLAKLRGAGIVSITGSSHNPLTNLADTSIHTGTGEEGSPHGLAPMASTTTQLVVGDAIISELVMALGKTREDFLGNHPGGTLGKAGNG